MELVIRNATDKEIDILESIDAEWYPGNILENDDIVLCGSSHEINEILKKIGRGGVTKKMTSKSPYTVSEGDIIFFKPGKNDRMVAYTPVGKVILSRNEIQTGYATVSNVTDRGNYYLVDSKHTLKDVYPGISPNEFIEVANLFGYKLGFDRTFTNNSNGASEHQIYAYNLQKKSVIIADTYTLNGVQEFNKMHCYCPGISVMDRNTKWGFCGDRTYSIISLNVTTPQVGLEKIVGAIPSKVKWPVHLIPNLSTYADSENSEIQPPRKYTRRLNRLKLAPDENLQIYEGCDFLKEI